MKRFVIISLMCFLGSILISGIVFNSITDPIFSKLGIRNTNELWKQFDCAVDVNCVFSAPRMDNLSAIKALASGDQINVAKEALDYTKSYYKSEAFLTAYEKERQAHKPKAAKLNEETRELYEMQLAEYREMYTPEVLDMLPEEAKAGALYELKRMEASLAGDMDPEDRKNWEFRYPADPNDLLIRSIKDFLEVTKDVDFNATTKLNTKNKHQVFTNPVYEKKDNQWKACYRAGKELTDFVRGYSHDWLSELERTKKNG